MRDETQMHPAEMTEEKYALNEQLREEARNARLAPYKALRRKMDAGLRFAVTSDAVSDEELLTMSAATMAWKPGMSLIAGDMVMHEGSMFIAIQAHTTQTGWEPGTATQALFRRVKQEGDTAWQPDTDYAAGEEVTYDGIAYTCVQAHTSQAGWEPPNVPALWAAKNE